MLGRKKYILAALLLLLAAPNDVESILVVSPFSIVGDCVFFTGCFAGVESGTTIFCHGSICTDPDGNSIEAVFRCDVIPIS